MTTYTHFLPTATAAFQFTPTLDGQQYTAVVTWNMVGRRYYISLFALNGIRILTLPVIGSVDAIPVQSASWANGFVTVVTEQPHGYILHDTVELTLSGMAPDAYNGTTQALITGQNEFQFPLNADPGDPTKLGIVNYNINITAGYFSSTSLVFRESSQQFEVSDIKILTATPTGGVVNTNTGGGGGLPTNQNFNFIISAAGIPPAKFVIDAGSSASYPGSGGTVTDLTGNGLNFNKNAMTFHGQSGGLSANEYFSSDGTDFLSIAEANPAWVEAIHQSNASFSCAGLIYFPGHAAPGASDFRWMSIFNTTTTLQHEGIAVAFYSWLQFSGGVNYYTGHFQADKFLLAGADDYQAGVEWYLTSTTPTPPGWYFVGASINQSSGVSTFFVNGLNQTSAGIFLGDTDSNPSDTVLGTGDATQPFTLDGRFAFSAGWDFALTAAPLSVGLQSLVP